MSSSSLESRADEAEGAEAEAASPEDAWCELVAELDEEASPEDVEALARERGAPPEALSAIARALRALRVLGGEDALSEAWSKTVVTDVSDPGQSLRPEREDSGLAEALRAAGERYRIGEVLGRGGMGVVHRAEQTSLRREVAIKRAVRKRPASVSAFLYEALTTGYLNHPNVVPVYDLIEEDEGWALAMKAVGGSPWSALLHPKTPAEEAAAARYELDDHLGILLTVMNAVAYAHSKGVAHLDLKPSNVMIGEFGEVLLMDWGLALDLDDAREGPPVARPRDSLRGRPCGTPSYMAPELARGRPERIGVWTDVYLLGGVLFELASGHPPHPGRTLWRALETALERGPALEEIPSHELRGICARALAHEPEERYVSVLEMRAALTDYLEHRESVRAAEVADAAAARCRMLHAGIDLSAEQRSRLYADLAAAEAGYGRALELWAENEAAARALASLRALFAEVALGWEDWALAQAQAEKLAPDDTRRAALLADVSERRLAAQEQARRHRRTRFGLALALGAVALLALASSLVFRAQRDEIKTALTDLDAQRRLADENLSKVERLADVTELESLLDEVDRLQPPDAEDHARIKAWLERADALRERLPLHRARLEELRAAALPYSDAERARDRTRNEELRAQVWTREWEEILARALDDPQRPLTPETRSWAESHLAWARERNAAAGEVPLDRRHSWTFARAALQWEHDQLTRYLGHGGDLDPGDYWSTYSRVKRLYPFARLVHSAARPAAWAEVIGAIERSPRYGGLKIGVQDGLEPMSENPATGLWEFALHLPGLDTPQRRRDDGSLVQPTWCSVILVLLPGGTFTMGTPGDEDAPPHEVTLEPFFMAKYELTQGQWHKVQGGNPSAYPLGVRPGGAEDVTALHPAESLTWTEAGEVARRLGLVLPTEAQWEYAARAGARGDWSWGDTPPGLGRGNFRDAAYARLPRVRPEQVAGWNDDYPAHAPVGTYPANAFGLHEVQGNVAEWVREGRYGYGIPRRASDGEGILISTAFKLHRGGSFATLPGTDERLGARSSAPRRTLSPAIGVRLARVVQR